MIKEFVPYTEALELKQLGFDVPCFFAFDNCSTPMRCTDLRTGEQRFNGVNYNSSSYTSQPTFSQAFRWFREKHDLVHHINRDGGWWLCSILDLYDEKEQGAIETHIDNCYPDTYEEAELACLRKLISIVKQKP